MLLACLKLVYFSTNWRPIKRSPKCDIVEVYTLGLPIHAALHGCEERATAGRLPPRAKLWI
jgi:hypothetical protein